MSVLTSTAADVSATANTAPDHQSGPSATIPAPAPFPKARFRTIHGHRRAFRMAGTGPALLLIHGLADSSTVWEPVMAELARHYTVIAPDLLGHGQSAKPPADYSPAGFANGMRDLLDVLGVDRVTVVGHSLGGGIAAQFAYQYPHRVERLALISTGGLMRGIHPILRSIAIPGSGVVLEGLRVPYVLPAVQKGLRTTGDLFGNKVFHDGREVARVIDGFKRPGAIRAFTRTLRSAVNWQGHRFTMIDRAYLTQAIPTLIIWGDRDTVLPLDHADALADALPHAEVEVYPDSAHFPFRDQPEHFVSGLRSFIDNTEPGVIDHETWTTLLRAGVPAG